MRSPMIENGGFVPAAEKTGYSALQVLRSAAGWYVGTTFVERDEKGEALYEEPGSRDSDYFGTEAKARAFLAEIEGNPADAPGLLRETP